MDLNANLFMLAGNASFLLKVLIDGIKLGVDLPRWGTPLMALIWSPILVWLLLVYGNAWHNTPSENAGIAVTSIVTFGLAVGVTELQKRVQARSEERGQGGTTP